MSFPSDVVLAAGTKLKVGKLAAQRTRPTVTVRATENKALVNPPNTFTLAVQALTEPLQEGQKIQFFQRTISGSPVNPANVGTWTLAADAASGATTITLIGNGIAITNATTETVSAIFSPDYQVLGGENLSFTISDNEVTTRSFEDGLYDDAKKIMVGATVPWSGHYVKGDMAIEKIIQPAANNADEIYFEIEYPDGLKRSGTTYIQGYTEENSMDSVRKVSWTFRVVGAFTFELAP